MAVADLLANRRDMVCLISAQWRRRTALLHTAGYVDIDDLVQDVVIAILSARPKSAYTASRGAWSTYLHTVSRTVVLQRVRAAGARQRRLPESAEARAMLRPPDSGQPDEWLAARETLEDRSGEVLAALRSRARAGRRRRHPSLTAAI